MSLSKTERRALITTTMHLLGEDPTPKTATWWQFNFVIREIGRGATEELLAVVAQPRPAETGRPSPVWVKSDGAPRSAGGVFFALARKQIVKARWNRIRWLSRDCFQKSQAKAQVPS